MMNSLETIESIQRADGIECIQRNDVNGFRTEYHNIINIGNKATKLLLFNCSNLSAFRGSSRHY